jgi:hypothetical protein
MVNELHQLAELHEQGHMSPTEYEQVKQQLLAASRQAGDAARRGNPAPDGALLLYRLASSWLRRTAAAMAIVALLFGLVAGWSGLRYLDMNAQMHEIKDVPIAQGFGVKIPDPRPTIERAILEAKATAYGGLAAVTGIMALSTLVGALLARPPFNPAEAEQGVQ